MRCRGVRIEAARPRVGDGSPWPRPRAGTVHLWAGFVDRHVERMAATAHLLSNDELVRLERMAAGPPRRTFLVARTALRRLLGRYTGRDPRTLEFAYTRQGKPYLAEGGGPSPLWFNVSHTEGLFAVAVAHDGDVGLDLERVQSRMGVADLAAKILTRRERDEWARTPDRARPQTFFEYWTRKEAVLKALGAGLTVDPSAIDVSRESAADGWVLHSFRLDPDYVGCIAAHWRLTGVEQRWVT